MTATKLKLKIEQGATFRKSFNRKVKSTNAPINMTGYTGRMQIRSEVTSPDAIVSLTTENGGIIIDPSIGKFTIYLSDVDTALLEFESAVYDLELIAPDGFVKRILEGEITLSPEVTRND